jgi:hypothetical protein
MTARVNVVATVGSRIASILYTCTMKCVTFILCASKIVEPDVALHHDDV